MSRDGSPFGVWSVAMKRKDGMLRVSNETLELVEVVAWSWAAAMVTVLLVLRVWD